MSKIVNLETAQKVGLNFLESVKPQKKEVDTKIDKTVVKTRKLELVHQASSLTQFAVRSKKQSRIELLTLKKTEEPCFYVFNSNDNGFVIVSAEESLNPILGYSCEGGIDETNIPPTMESHLEGMRQVILKIRKDKLPTKKDILSKWSKLTKDEEQSKDDTDDDREDEPSSVEPLIKTKWGQGYPYNKFCPNKSVTGCVATAMAQVMKYHACPINGVGSHTSSGITANFDSTTY